MSIYINTILIGVTVGAMSSAGFYISIIFNEKLSKPLIKLTHPRFKK